MASVPITQINRDVAGLPARFSEGEASESVSPRDGGLPCVPASPIKKKPTCVASVSVSLSFSLCEREMASVPASISDEGVTPVPVSLSIGGVILFVCQSIKIQAHPLCLLTPLT